MRHYLPTALRLYGLYGRELHSIRAHIEGGGAYGSMALLEPIPSYLATGCFPDVVSCADWFSVGRSRNGMVYKPHHISSVGRVQVEQFIWATETDYRLYRPELSVRPNHSDSCGGAEGPLTHGFKKVIPGRGKT
jgi:hypothetical protein